MKFIKTYEGRTLQDDLLSELRTAINLGTPVDIESLIKRGLNVNVRKKNDSIGDTPLISAIKEDANHSGKSKVRRKIIEDLIKNGADVNMTNDAGRNGMQSPLIIASLWKSDIEVVKMLIDAGADINSVWENKDFYGCALFGSNAKLAKWIEEKYPTIVSTKRFDL